MKLLIVLLSVTALLDAKPAINRRLKASVDAPFIINGEDAEPGEFPWQLSLKLLGLHICGASLYTDTIALTAAHCIDGFNVNNMEVSAGQYQLDQDESEYQLINVTEARMHEEYQIGEGSYPNDIAMLFLAEAVDLTPDDVRGINPSHPDDGDWTNGDCYITGWGRYHQNISQELHNTLQKANMPVITNEECQSHMDNVLGAQIIDSHICVYNDYQGACNGDSGGPMSCRHTENDDFLLAGITSWGVVSIGEGCQVSFPSVYTRVSSHYDWIMENMP